MSSDNTDMRTGVLIVLLMSFVPLSAEADVSFASSPLWLYPARVTEGQPVRVSTAVMKSSEEDVAGSVSFYAGETLIGSARFDLPSSVSGTVVAVSWTPAAGEYAISATISRTDSEAATVSPAPPIRLNDTLIVSPDADRDRIPDAEDTDDDNDGVSDIDENARGTDPLKPDVNDVQHVRGASSTAAFAEGVKERAVSAGSTFFTHAENLRTRGAVYVDDKLREAISSVDTNDETASAPTDESLVVEPRSFMEQARDMSKLLHGTKVYLLKAASFILNSMYAFYFVLLAIILFVVRRIWKRHSLD